MRRILVENARRKQRAARRRPGTPRSRPEPVFAADPREDLLALDAALNDLAACNRQAADLVQLRYFAGLTLPEAADALGISPRTAGRLWAYARAWLPQAIEGADESGASGQAIVTRLADEVSGDAKRVVDCAGYARASI